MEFHERLESVMKEKKLSKYRLAVLLGISKTTVSNYLKGKTKPQAKKIDSLCETLLINRLWLETGNGLKDMVTELSPSYRKAPVEKEENDIALINSLGSRFKQLREEIKKLKKENDRLRRKK